MIDKSDVLTITALVAAITARQEEIEWALRCTAAVVAIGAGSIAIWQKLRRKPGAGESTTE
jgi:ABC-type nickel/cobalt efflux system permease component RcnA